MKIMVINAAPRMEVGNTQVVLNPFCIGMRDAGAEIDLALLGGKNIQPCIGCFTCYAKTPGQCIHEDDVPELTHRIRQADILVLATPIYIDGMTSLAKRFLDRLVVFLDPHFNKDDEGLIHPLRWKFPDKLFLVSICGYPNLHNFDPILLHMKKLARNFHTEFSGALLRPAAFSILLSRKYPEQIHSVLGAARKAGAELVSAGVVSKETLTAAAADICSPEELMATANSYWDREIANNSKL